jgi:putative ABC transport system permease protein
MRRNQWTGRFDGWLPADSARDCFRPAVADLEREHVESGHFGWRYQLRLTILWLQCLQLAAFERLTPGRHRRCPHSPRKEWIRMLARDLHHALRQFRREPAFAATAVLTLTLGIGANTALFAVVEAVLLRPLPVPSASDVVVLRHRDAGTGITKQFIAIGDFVDLRQRQQSLEALAGYGGFQSTLFDAGEPIRVEGIVVAPEMFQALRFQPAMGRVFTQDDVRQGAPPVVIVSQDLWRTQLGSDPQVLSRSIQLGATRRMVVGVAPAGFRFPPGDRTDVIVPVGFPPAPPANRKAGWTFALGRINAGMTLDAVEQEFATLSQQLAAEHPEQNQGSVYEVRSLRDTLVGETKTPLLLLLAGVGCVLLIACANVGNLLLARALARHQEFAMRLALGAARARLVRQILTESLVLAMAGGLVGTVAAWQLAPALAAMVPRTTPIPGLDTVGINGWVLAFSLAASLTSALVFSAVACVGLTRDGARAALAAERRTTMSPAAQRAASSLIAAEIALAVVLLMAAGLTLRSFANLMSVDPGFTPAGVLTVQMGLPAGRYPDPFARRTVFDRTFAALEALPDVESVGAAVVTPLTGNNWIASLERPEHPLPPGQRPPEVGWQAASGGYFRTLKIPVRAGRVFDTRDMPKGPAVVIVSDALAQRFFPGEDPVGKRVRQGNVTAEIVGVVGSIRRATLADAPREDMYYPFEQGPSQEITLFIRTKGRPLDALAGVRTAIRSIEPHVVFPEARTLDEIAGESAAVTRLAMRLLAGFAIIALVLAAVGIYGVMSYNVRRRTRELGTRIALGARRADIVRLVLRQAAVVALIGVTAGVAAGLVCVQALSSLLFGVPPWDPVAIGAAALVLTATALVAGYLPARSAARVDPASTLAAK